MRYGGLYCSNQPANLVMLPCLALPCLAPAATVQSTIAGLDGLVGSLFYRTVLYSSCCSILTSRVAPPTISIRSSSLIFLPHRHRHPTHLAPFLSLSF
ncbi:hypothetical protein BCV70DRAFT_20673 [Testicularia cyperi]|uniref:Uncharacterized protein n=1 Tax=Testicularia cyperi TaxID=1882483 RepID=A0A317Y234_9BASI|nr:hypothetical protein BCV70DRAFT_20673 [Testicularia cyperi]